MPLTASFHVHTLPYEEVALYVGGLADTLYACVREGASVGYVLPFERSEALNFWEDLLPAIQRGERLVFAAMDDGRIVGTVQLLLNTPPNGAHRAELAKLLVSPDERRRGVARALLRKAERVALASGRNLIVLDTRQDGPAEALFRSSGYQTVGVIPGYATTTRGALAATTVMYKSLEDSPAS